jgi:sugar fermentation stimulation protein A
MIKAISIMWDIEMEFRFIKELSIPWHIYEMEARDRGCYIITGLLRMNRTIEIGSYGRINFKKGYYLYTGSAMNSLSSRIKRHLRKEKTMRWHIDYLIPYLQDLKAIPIQSSEDLECLLSESLSSVSEGYIKGFGSSDCHCQSHLYWMQNNPLSDERFIDILLKYRIGRLKNLID